MADEYIRKADAVEECGEWYVEEGPEEGFIGTVSQMLDMFLPADVVQVVRCDDCIYYGSRRWCDLHSSVFEDNAFCSYGERREEQEHGSVL